MRSRLKTIFGRGRARRLLFYPPITRAEDLNDTVSRAAWFLTYSDFERITILIADPSLEDVVWRVAPDMDPLIAERFEALRDILRLVPDDSPDLADVIDETDVILRWSTAADCPEPPEVKQIIDVDPRRTRHEGGNYIELGFRSSDNPEFSESRQQQKFADLAARLGNFDRAVILATGPSAADYGDFEYGDSLRIVCNTAVLDHELMKVVNPQIVVFLDPVFHFGPSSYAAQFRAKVREAAEEFDFEIVIASKYLPVFAAALPELLDRTIAIPFKPGRDFNFDLREDFEVRATANVLTFMMIPLAGTFAKTIGMLGCDGRPMNESGHFWKHHPSTQLGSELDALRRVHPGFFDIEYNEYYLEHCRTLEAEIEAGERAGLDFVSLAPSHIPALAERTGGTAVFSNHASRRAQAKKATNEARRLLIVDPSRTGSMAATGQLKAALLSEWPDECFRQLYVNDKGRLALASSLHGAPADRQLTVEQALDEVVRFRPEVVYYRPVIDRHPDLHKLAREILDRQAVPVVSHIMDDWPSRLAGSDADRAIEADRELREIFSRSRVALSISDEMSAVFQERYGVPFVAIANGVDLTPYDQVRQAAIREKESRDEVVVRYVGAVAKDMVFTTLVDVARAVDELQGELPVRFEVYTRHPWSKPYKRAIRGLSGTTVLESVPGPEYPRVLASADILLIAYNFDAASVDYIRYSMPNKLPECLASGAALLAIGPSEATSIKFVADRDLAYSLTEPGSAGITNAIRELARDPELRAGVSARGTSFARAHMNISDASARFREVLLEAAEDPPPTPLVGIRRSVEQASATSSSWAGSAWPRRLRLRGALRRAVSALRRR